MKTNNYKISIKIECDSRQDFDGVLKKINTGKIRLSTSETKVHYKSATAVIKSNVGEMLQREIPRIEIINNVECAVYSSKLNNEK